MLIGMQHPVRTLSTISFSLACWPYSGSRNQALETGISTADGLGHRTVRELA